MNFFFSFSLFCQSLFYIILFSTLPHGSSSLLYLPSSSRHLLYSVLQLDNFFWFLLLYYSFFPLPSLFSFTSFLFLFLSALQAAFSHSSQLHILLSHSLVRSGVLYT